MIRAIDPKPDETFIEIGPGRGALTRPLAARARTVVAMAMPKLPPRLRIMLISAEASLFLACGSPRKAMVLTGMNRKPSPTDW